MQISRRQLPSIFLLASLLIAGLSAAGATPARASLPLAALVGVGALVLLASQARLERRFTGWLRFLAASLVVYLMGWAALTQVGGS